MDYTAPKMLQISETLKKEAHTFLMYMGFSHPNGDSIG